MSTRFKIHTFGCKVNTYDSGLLQSRIKRGGYSIVDGNDADVHVLNTCAVTKEATKEAVKLSRRLKASNPSALVVVTGCSAQVDTGEFEHLPGVDLVIANSHKGQLEDLVARYYRGELREKVFKSNIFKKDDLEAGGGLEEGHTRSFLKIQDGCNSFCTFCVIPFARGKSRSLSIAELVVRVRDLVASGHQEVVLTGVHIADYQDGDKVLEDLVEAILEETNVPRLRLTSLEPGEVSPRLLSMFADDRLCPHFHMSIQSANSKVLHDMKRRYDAQAVEESLKTIAERVPGAYVGMDVIAGFPGETEDEFLDSYERLKRLPWTRLHVFPYSNRPGTFASRRSDGVPHVAIKQRAAMLRRLSDERLESEILKQVGGLKFGLMLRSGKLLTRDFWSVELASDEGAVAVNQEVLVRIESARDGVLVGSVTDATAPISISQRLADTFIAIT